MAVPERILITGGAGFIGRFVTRELATASGRRIWPPKSS
jgi:nucleoside-diphosphate-sugar epimerase